MLFFLHVCFASMTLSNWFSGFCRLGTEIISSTKRLVLLQFSWAVQFLTRILSFDSIGVAIFANIFLRNLGRTSLWIHEETGSSPAAGRRENRRAELWSLSATIPTSPPYNHSLLPLVMLWWNLKTKPSFCGSNLLGYGGECSISMGGKPSVSLSCSFHQWKPWTLDMDVYSQTSIKYRYGRSISTPWICCSRNRPRGPR